MGITLVGWNKGVLEKKYTEKDLIHREGVTMINIDCPSCGCHLYEQSNIYYRDGVALKYVFCGNCDFDNGERLVASE